MSTAPPSLAVVITNYNYRQYVAEAVDSALAQTVKAAQIVVVDDGSTDGSLELLQARFGARPEVAVSGGPNAGQLAALRRGVALVHADIVVLLDADDTWDPRYLEALLAVYGADAAVDMVAANVRFTGEPPRLLRPDCRDRDCGVVALAACYVREVPGAPTSALSFRRRMLQRILELPVEFDAEWRLCADVCVTLGAGLLGARIRELGEPLVHYRMHPANAYAGKAFSRVQEHRNIARDQRAFDYFRQRAGLNEHWLRHAHVEFKTKPRPSWREWRIYTGLTWRAPAPVSFKIWATLSMVRHKLSPRVIPTRAAA